MKRFLFLLCTICLFALTNQQLFAQTESKPKQERIVGNGQKGQYDTKSPVTVESLTRDAEHFDTFVETGVKVYRKKTAAGKDYYFVVVPATTPEGQPTFKRRKVNYIPPSN